MSNEISYNEKLIRKKRIGYLNNKSQVVVDADLRKL